MTFLPQVQRPVKPVETCCKAVLKRSTWPCWREAFAVTVRVHPDRRCGSALTRFESHWQGGWDEPNHEHLSSFFAIILVRGSLGMVNTGELSGWMTHDRGRDRGSSLNSFGHSGEIGRKRFESCKTSRGLGIKVAGFPRPRGLGFSTFQ